MARKKQDASPLDAKQRALHEQQEQLRREMENLERLIQDAPQAAEQAERRRREQLLQRASQSSMRFDSRTSLSDRRYDAHTAVARPRQRAMKREQRDARLKFLALCVFLFVVCLYLWMRFAQ